MKEYYDCLVLSGGAIKGFGTLGSLQCMKDKNYLDKIKTIVGTSVGTIIGYLLSI